VYITIWALNRETVGKIYLNLKTESLKRDATYIQISLKQHLSPIKITVKQQFKSYYRFLCQVNLIFTMLSSCFAILRNYHTFITVHYLIVRKNNYLKKTITF